MELILGELTKKVIGAGLEVHKRMGPGYMESVYHNAFIVELKHQQIQFETQKSINLMYRGIQIGLCRIDLIIEGQILAELKSVSGLEGIHFAQIKSYLKASGLKVGLLLNFNKSVLEIKRFVL